MPAPPPNPRQGNLLDLFEYAADVGDDILRLPDTDPELARLAQIVAALGLPPRRRIIDVPTGDYL